MVEIFNEVVVTMLNKHAPLRTFKEKPNATSTKPWYSKEIDRASTDRDLAKKKLKHDKTVENRKLYNSLRNKMNQMIRVAKEAYLKPRLSANLGMKTLWRNAKALGFAKSSSCVPFPAFTAHEFNVHTSCFEKYNQTSVHSATATATCKLLRYDMASHCLPHPQLAFRNVTEVEIYNSLMSIKSNAVGVDNVPLPFIKLLTPNIIPHISHIINYSITSSRCSDAWKLSKICPVHKRGRFCNISDYRAIHILPVLSKLLEILLANQINEFLSLHELMSPFQSGFRSHHSTASALLKITHDVSYALDKKQLAILLLLDFSKAFDSVDHDLLCAKLQSQFHFDASALRLVSSYLSDRRQAVDICGVHCTFLPITKGVPQGSVLGPLLFCLFINDLPNSVKYMFTHLYADDAQLYKFFTSSEINVTFDQVNMDLNTVCEWPRINLH